MQGKKTGNTKIRQEHKSIVLNYIRRYGPVSRTELFEKTKISKPTVTRIIEEFLCQGLVIVTGTLGTSSGRKPVNIALNPDAYFCIGINISKSNIYASIVDFTMNLRYKSVTSIKQVKDEKEFIQVVTTVINRLLEESQLNPEKLLGIGVGAPGVVNFTSGEIIDFGFTHSLPGVNLKASLEKTFQRKVLVDNNANTRALGEYWYGVGRGYRNIVFVICSEGIGSGIISEGNILRGKNNVTGEFGHMTVNLDGRKCSCGRYGCIEAYCSIEAIENLAKEALKRGRVSEAITKKGKDIDSIDYKTLCEGADEGDGLCVQLLEETAYILSTGLQNLIGIVDPEVIILSGDLFDASQIFFDKVVQTTKERLYSSYLHDVVFEKRRVEDSLYEVGAAALIYKSFFND